MCVIVYVLAVGTSLTCDAHEIYYAKEVLVTYAQIYMYESKFARTNKDIVCKHLQSTERTSMHVQVSSNILHKLRTHTCIDGINRKNF